MSLSTLRAETFELFTSDRSQKIFQKSPNARVLVKNFAFFFNWFS